METAKVDLKPGARVHILSVGGDLRLTGSDTSRLEAQAGRRGGLRVKTRDEVVEIVSASGCLVFLPATCPVEVSSIGGDGRITDMARPVTVGAVGGDLKLRRLQGVTVQTIGGDLLAQRLSGAFEVQYLGGDALLERIDGAVRFTSLGGDLRIRSLAGWIEARVGGDAALALSPAAGTRSSVRAGGDITCRVAPDASLRARLASRGELRVGVNGAQSVDEGGTTIVMGAGEAEVVLEAGGDLSLLGALEAPVGDLAGSIEVEVDDVTIEDALREAEAGIDAALGPGAFASGNVGEHVRRALDRALRPGPSGRVREASGETVADLGVERALILKMISEGKITAAEGEALFRALGADG